VGRYFRLLGAFARFGLIGEMAFRMNFLAKLAVEIIWLVLLLIFYHTVFTQTDHIRGWNQAQFLCFLGIYYALEGIIETFFLENCSEFADLIRSGNLDLYLLRPIDEQFLVTCRKVDWSTVPNIILGFCLLGFGLSRAEWAFDPVKAALFVLTFFCGVAMAYSFLVLLMSTAVWLVRNQSLMELWWLFTTLMRYPRDIYVGKLASPLGWFFSFVVPVLLVVNVPAETLVKVLDPVALGMGLLATVLLLWLSRAFFQRALRSYRSASS